MIATLEKVAVIFMGWKQLRKSFALGIFGPQYSNIVTRRLKNAHPVSFSIQKRAPTPLLYTPSLPLALLKNGGIVGSMSYLHA